MKRALVQKNATLSHINTKAAFHNTVKRWVIENLINYTLILCNLENVRDSLMKHKRVVAQDKASNLR